MENCAARNEQPRTRTAYQGFDGRDVKKPQAYCQHFPVERPVHFRSKADLCCSTAGSLSAQAPQEYMCTVARK